MSRKKTKAEKKAASQRFHQAKAAERGYESQQAQSADKIDPQEMITTVTYSFRMEDGAPYVQSQKNKALSYNEASILTPGFDSEDQAHSELDIIAGVIDERNNRPENIEKIVVKADISSPEGFETVGALSITGNRKIHGYILAELKGKNYASGRHNRVE